MDGDGRSVVADKAEIIRDSAQHAALTGGTCCASKCSLRQLCVNFGRGQRSGVFSGLFHLCGQSCAFLQQDRDTMSEAASTALRDQILQELEANSKIENLRVYCEAHNVPYKLADGVCRGLAAAEYTLIKDVSKSNFNLTPEARDYLQNGSPEFRFLAAVPPEGKLLKDLQQECGSFARLGMAKCMMRRWIKQDKATGTISRLVEGDVKDEVVEQLRAIDAAPADNNTAAVPAKIAKDLKKRKLIKDVKVTSLVVKKGPRFSTTFKKQVADLTKDMLDG